MAELKPDTHIVIKKETGMNEITNEQKLIIDKIIYTRR